MTREEAKALLPIIQAFANGKEIELYDSFKGWVTIKGDSFDFVFSPSYYRIKQGLRYRQFKDKDECWQEMLKHQPFGWIKHKETKAYEDCRCIFNNGIVGASFKDAYKNYTFVDGTPFGIKEE